MSETPLPPGLRPGGAAEIERDLERPLTEISADQSQGFRDAINTEIKPQCAAHLRARLAREYLDALHSTRFADLDPLVAAGVGWRAITDAVPVHARITVSKDTFEFDEEGSGAFVLPVRLKSTVTPEAAAPIEAIRDGAVIDLVAFHPSYPTRWALRTAAAEWLGAIEPQYLDPEPLAVWRTPLGWLQAGCRGLVLLSKERESRYRVLSSLGAIIAEDQRHAVELRQELGRPWPVPRVLMGTSPEVRRAA